MTKIRMVPEDHITDAETVAGGLLAARFGFRGTGSPIGQLDDAPAGSRYTDTAATSGAVGWTKYPAGWRVTDGDTGWVEVTPDVGSAANHPTIKVYLRRLNEVVHARLIESGAAAAGTGVTTIYTLPVGFKPGDTAAVFTGPVMDAATGAPLAANAYISPGAAPLIRLYRAPAALHIATLSWPAEATWPSL